MGKAILTIRTWSLPSLERRMAIAALDRAGTIKGAAELLDILPSRLKRIMVTRGIEWPRRRKPRKGTNPGT